MSVELLSGACLESLKLYCCQVILSKHLASDGIIRYNQVKEKNLLLEKTKEWIYKEEAQSHA